MMFHPSLSSLRIALLTSFAGLLISSPAFSQCPERAELFPLTLSPNDRFGSAIGVDGDLLAIGSRNAESVTLFGKIIGSWFEGSEIRPDDAGGPKEFGSAVSVSGNRVAVGAWNDDEQGSTAGAVYIFDYVVPNWVQTAKLFPSNAAGNSRFGFSVALSGNTLFVGAPTADVRGPQSGGVTVFEDLGFPIGWIETQLLEASDGDGNDEFGKAIDVDGDRLLVGAPFASNGSANTGAAYIFEKTGSDWIQQAKLTGSAGGSTDQFGRTVSISGDDALVGAPDQDGNLIDEGAAYLYRYDNGQWPETDMLSRFTGNEEFGHSVSIDGDALLVGCPKTLTAYSYIRKSGVWAFDQVMEGSDILFSGEFGDVVHLQGNEGFIGAPTHSQSHQQSGSAYVFPVKDLLLQVYPSAVQASDSLNFDTFCGNPSSPVLVIASAINGNPAFDILLLSQFFANHHFGFSATVPQGLSGLSIEFQTFKLDAFNNVLPSNQETIQFL